MEILRVKTYLPFLYLFTSRCYKHKLLIYKLFKTIKYDYLIITSKQSCEALKQYAQKEYINIPALCVSTQSANSYEALGGKVLDVGSGYGDSLTSKIKEFEKDTKWLYLRAQEVASDFVDACKIDGYCIDESIVYSSECSKEIIDADVKDGSILIFTSPSSLNCFLKKHTIFKESKVIVIGETTAKALPENIDYFVSQKTTIESCMNLAFTL